MEEGVHKHKIAYSPWKSLGGHRSWDNWATGPKTFKTTQLRCSPGQSWPRLGEPILKAWWHPNNTVNGTSPTLANLIWETACCRVISIKLLPSPLSRLGNRNMSCMISHGWGSRWAGSDLCVHLFWHHFSEATDLWTMQIWLWMRR